MRTILKPLAVTLIGLFLLSSCVQVKTKRGVEVAWQNHLVEGLVKGESTRKQVMDLLGPPSQVISLQNETALYYLFEKAEGEGMLLIVYNRMEIDTRYDRAIFFFDENNILTDYSAHVHAHDEK
jgi:outer membrane protein assembly factor BamE (lipoprotein component of BamABCDE complex)